jgi:hypothetical protein
MKDGLKKIDGEIYAVCPDCGNEQPDMGRNVKCENCGYGPMPFLPPEGAFVSGAGTVRICIDCGVLVSGGPTRCTDCVDKMHKEKE